MANTAKPMRTTVKLSLADETHRVTLDTASLSFDTLCALVRDTFPAHRPPQHWTLVYTDNEGDLVTVASAAEFDEAHRVLCDLDTAAATNSARTPTMHFRIMPTVSASDQLPAAAMHAVDELAHALARLATDARDSIAQSGAYLKRGRATVVLSATRTRELFDAARREVTQRLRDVQTCVAGEIARRRSSAADGEVPVDEVPAVVQDVGVTPTSDSAMHHVLDADNSSAVYDSDNDDAVDSDNDDAVDSDDEPDVPAPALVPAVERAADGIAIAAADASDAETVADSDDSDDSEADSDDEWTVVPAVWDAHVAIVRSILPHVHVDDCVTALRRHGGDLEAVINELTDA